MTKFGMIVLAVVLVSVAVSNAQQQRPPRPPLITDFTKVANGFEQAWQNANPQNFQNDYRCTFADKLYVIGQRNVRSRNDQPGGIVSSYDPRRRPAWTHDTHSLNIGNSKFVIFSLASRPIMLVYSEPRNDSIRFQTLYYWNDRPARWVPIRLDVDRQVFASNSRSPIYVSVPDQAGSIAYINLLALTRQRDGRLVSRPVIFVLNVDLRGGASLKVFSRNFIDADDGIVFSAIRDQSTVRAFGLDRYSSRDGNTYWRVKNRYDISRRNGAPSRPASLVDNSIILGGGVRGDHVFQVKNFVIFIGWQLQGRGGNIPHIWVYDTNRGQWRDRNLGFPDSPLAVDQKNNKVYAVDRNQVQVADLVL